MRDPYEVLGVERRASASEIKAAFRRLAKECHPDRSPGDARVAARFQEISAAYSFLCDERMRRRYDAGEIDAAGRRRRFGNWEMDDSPGHEAWKAGFAGEARQGASGGVNGRAADELYFKFSSSEREEAFRSQSIFSELFGNLRGAPRLRRRGPDTTYRLNVSFEEAMCGATRRVRLPSGKRLDVRIPPGAETGQHIRLKGEGEPGPNGKAGDALIVLQVEPHAIFRREGLDIHMDLDVSVAEAVLGATVVAPTIHGPVKADIPPGSNSGALLRLAGKGVIAGDGPAGDHIAVLRVMLPGPEDQAFTDFIRRWAGDRARVGDDAEPAPHEHPFPSEE